MAESRPESRPETKTKTEKDWRELCAAAAEELDSIRLASPVNQIIEAIDEHQTLPRRRLSGSGGPASPTIC
jgi:hypothetical protein